jgi:hypothetical protein
VNTQRVPAAAFEAGIGFKKKKCCGGRRKSLKKLDSAKESATFNLDFLPPDLEFLPPGLDFLPKNLDIVPGDLEIRHRLACRPYPSPPAINYL